MTTDEMVELLERFSVEVSSVQGNEVHAKCPGHFERTGKLDRNPSWSINAKTGAHKCWSCNFRGSLQYLVSFLGGVEMEDVPEFLTKRANDRLSKAFEALLNPVNVNDAPLVILPESQLALYEAPPTNALKSRGLTASAAELHEVLWDPQRLCWIIPIREPYSNGLLGWQEKGYTGRYFKNQPEGVRKRGTLFGFNQYKGKDMILVESPLDVVRLTSLGIAGGVAAYGAGLAKDQYTLLLDADRLIVAMDNDDAGRQSSADIMKWARERGKGIWFFNYTQTDMKDIGGMSRVEVVYGLENAMFSVRGEKVLQSVSTSSTAH